MSAPHCQGAIKVGTYVGKKEEILGYYYYVISNIALLYAPMVIASIQRGIKGKEIQRNIV